MIWNLESFGTRTALVEGDNAVSYTQLCRLSANVENTLTQAPEDGPSPGAAASETASTCPQRPVAFLLCSNTAGCIAAYLGCLEARVVPLLLDRKLDPALLRTLVQTYGPTWLIAPEDDVSALSAEFPGLHVRQVVEGYAFLRPGANGPYPVHPGLALLVSTSGSTGTPKLIRLSFDNIRANTASIIEYLGITASERAITSLPMNYVYGLSVIQTHLSAGATLVLTDLNCYAGAFWRLFAERECTSFAGVPFMYEMLDKLKFTRQLRYPTLTTMTQAGGHLPAALQERFALFARDNGIRFFVMYGASEATARMSYLPPEQAIEKQGSIGIAIPGGRFELAQDRSLGNGLEAPQQGNASQVESTGELVYYGDNVSMGYATSPIELALGDSNQGRLATGDIARRDEDGYYYIVGRKKRFIKILGKRTSLDEAEDLLKTHFPEIELACGGQDNLLAVFVADRAQASDADRDAPFATEPANDPASAMHADESGSVDARAIAECAHEIMGINAKMVRVVRVAEIPKNPSGKVLFASLNALLD